MIGFGDNIGSGLTKIMKAWEKLGLGKPEIHEEEEVNEVWLTLPLNPTFNVPQNVPQNLTERQKQIITNIKKNPTITRTALASILGVTVKTIQRELKAISNIVQFKGPSKGGHWELVNTGI